MEWKKIAYQMAKEISILRRENDLEWGEFCQKDYEEDNIIKEYIKEIERGKNK